MAVFLVAGTPGQSKTKIIDKVKKFLATKNIKVGHGNVEERLLAIGELGAPQRLSPNESLAKLIGTSPQDKIRHFWPKAFGQAVEVAQQGSPAISLVSCCLHYYRSETHEFYSPVELKAIQDSSPKGILTLIDDIYDVYYRLSQAGEVFSIAELQGRIRQSERGKTDRAMYKSSIDLVIQSLLRILVWREKEIDVGSAVGRYARCAHDVIATKHPIETVVRVLLGSHSKEVGLGESLPVYVSHPITRPRQERHVTGKWPDFVSHLNVVVDTLASEDENGRRVVPIMPTAIDEYRLLRVDGELMPILSPRWPLMDSQLLYCRPQSPNGDDFNSDEEFERRGLRDVFDPPMDDQGRRLGVAVSDPELSGMLRTLNEAVRLQMAGRDHLLVRQCKGFFLFRPLHEAGTFSRGVQSELHTYDQIRKWDREQTDKSARRIAFVHGSDDVQLYFGEDANGKFRSPVNSVISRIQTFAAQIARDSGKTMTPEQAGKSVSMALREPGDPQKTAPRVYDELFPKPTVGPIGEEGTLSSDEFVPGLIKELATQRAAALAGLLEGKYSYTFSRKDVEYEMAKDGCSAPADTYIDVVDALDDKDHLEGAAARARQFFRGV
ncbi:MAG: hypothetical protein IID34_08945 [Planctomycetes bacterium]|nr:hypothetical protein [Planctomycetota bacterium]